MKYLVRDTENLSAKLYQFYLDEVLVDFTFYCANKERVRCHSIVLMAYSKSLRELLKNSNTCNFTKVSFTSKTVKKFMEFLYTGKTSGSKDDIEDVQEFAKVYGIKYKNEDEKGNSEVNNLAAKETAEMPEITNNEIEEKNDTGNDKASQAVQSKEIQNSESVIVIEEDVQVIEINDSTEGFDHVTMKPIPMPELSFITLPRRNDNLSGNNKTDSLDSQESFRFSADIEILENGNKLTPINVQNKGKHSIKKKRTPKKGNNPDGENTPKSQGLVLNPFSVLKKKKFGEDGPSTSTQIHDGSITDKNMDNGPLPKKIKGNSQP